MKPRFLLPAPIPQRQHLVCPVFLANLFFNSTTVIQTAENLPAENRNRCKRLTRYKARCKFSFGKLSKENHPLNDGHVNTARVDKDKPECSEKSVLTRINPTTNQNCLNAHINYDKRTSPYSFINAPVCLSFLLYRFKKARQKKQNRVKL